MSLGKDAENDRQDLSRGADSRSAERIEMCREEIRKEGADRCQNGALDDHG